MYQIYGMNAKADWFEEIEVEPIKVMEDHNEARNG